MAVSLFRFKQFAVKQDRCAMKIGTDGVLLGAWATIKSPATVLDIGAGTGVIALMVAQRSAASQIDALEIDGEAFEQCVANFEDSPWGDRLFCYHASFQDFVAEMQGETYDLIISNPPFFKASKKEQGLSMERQKARFRESLPFTQLLRGAAALLSNKGKLAVIIPFEERDNFVTLAETEKLYLQKETRVRGHLQAPLRRSLLQFGFEQQSVQEDELVIEIARHQYTEAYTALTRDFYLNME